MKSYGMRGDMNPQKAQKAKMSNSKHGKGSKQENPGKGKGSHDMSPKVKNCKEQAVWQNMRG